MRHQQIHLEIQGCYDICLVHSKSVTSQYRITQSFLVVWCHIALQSALNYDWLKLRRETNSLEPKKGNQKGHSHTITDWNEFAKFVQKHAHLTSPSMCIEWQKIYGKRIATSVMKRGLQRLGYTFKKNNFAMRNQTKLKEQIFLREIDAINPEDIVYSDETGIDDNEVSISG